MSSPWPLLHAQCVTNYLNGEAICAECQWIVDDVAPEGPVDDGDDGDENDCYDQQELTL